MESQQVAQTTQQQQSLNDIYQRFQIADEYAVNIDQRLAALEAMDNQLLTANTEIEHQLSDFESKLDARAVNKILAIPWKYFAIAIAILLAGIFIGVLCLPLYLFPD